jgi:hypothetical protein
VSPANVSLSQGHRALVEYAVTAGQAAAGFFGLSVLQFCAPIPLAVGYEPPQINSSDFPGFFGARFCPAQSLDAKIVGFVGASIAYLRTESRFVPTVTETTLTASSAANVTKSDSDWRFMISLNATAIYRGDAISFTCYLTNLSNKTQTVIVASPLCNGPTIETQENGRVWTFEPPAINAAMEIAPGQTISGQRVSIPTSELHPGLAYDVKSYPNVLTVTSPGVFFLQRLQVNATLIVR